MPLCIYSLLSFLFNNTATTEIYTSSHPLSLHGALPISEVADVDGERSRSHEPERCGNDRPGRHPAPLGSITTGRVPVEDRQRSEEHTSELQSLMRISYAVFCLKKKKTTMQS